MSEVFIMSRKAIIIGAGIGGLSTAIALQKIGWQVEIFDRATDFQEAGAGIVLAANAMKVLKLFGVDEQVKGIGARVGRAEIRDNTGILIVNLPTSTQAVRYGSHSYLIHRAELQSILLQKVEGAVRLQKKLIDIKQDENNVTTFFQDGSRETCDVLIGADGINSAVRDLLYPASNLRYSGFTAFRGICEYKDNNYLAEDGGGFEAWGKGKRFGFSQLGNGKVFWFAAVNSPADKAVPLLKRKQEALNHFKGWCEPIEKVIDASINDSILHHAIFDRVPLKKWSKGRVTLLGDAAHPMLPNLGQGGAQSMEDAVVLSNSLKKNMDITEALSVYEKQRIPRTTKVVNQSRKMGRMVQAANPLVMKTRNTLLRSLPSTFIANRLDWVVGHEINLNKQNHF
jgi:2-polyprenyl-6-methoxyphenol hydroxylase-like FAD-dependent oxidoreductase